MTADPPPELESLWRWLPEGGATGALIRDRDWSETPLGAMETWPPVQRAAVATVLNSAVPMVVLWGPELIQLYNDAYAQVPGAKHPQALGMPTAECWPETWDELSPIYDAVWRGKACRLDHKHLVLYRNGTAEDAWFDFSFSPLRDETAAIVGILAVVVETTGREQGRQALAASEHRVRRERRFLDTLIEQAPVGISIADAASGDAIVLNQKATELLGHGQPRNALDRYKSYKAVHPDGRPYAVEDYPTVRAMHHGEVVDEEMIYRRPDGTVVTLAVNSAPVRDPQGGAIVAAVTVLRDITDQKKAGERQQLLLHELNHRVKNTLAAIQSVAHQTLRSAPTPEAFVTSFSNRLMALSQSHNLLTAGNWEGADLRRILAAELAPYRNQNRRQVRLSGPDVYLGPRAVLSLGMAFHELTTNAAKYGALSVPDGSVTVRWEWLDPAGAPEGGPPRLCIGWEEENGPPVAPPTRQGFGSRLIQRGLVYELGGRADLDYRPDGLRCVIEFPLAELPEDEA